MRLNIVSESHGAGGSSADYALADGEHVRVSAHWGTLPVHTKVYAVSDWHVIHETDDWQDCEQIMEKLGYDAEPFPLRNNPYLGYDYRKERGWL